jgi:transcriptional regulator with XRE-family HTH domain
VPGRSQQKILMPINPEQVRAGRALLDMSQTDLAKRAMLGLSTVVDFEKSRRIVSDSAIEAIRTALESAGVIFVSENGEGPGVRLRKGQSRRSPR